MRLINHFVTFCFVIFKVRSSVVDNNTENVKSRVWWPVGCLMYGVPVSGDPEITESFHDEVTSDIKFILFSHVENFPDQILVLEDVSSVIKSKFNILLPTKLLIHGWRDNTSNEFVQIVKNAYFNGNSLNNVIDVDWGKLADSLNYPVVAKEYVPKVGIVLGKFIEFLVHKISVPINNIQIIGHSLGGQVCGYAGQYLIKKGIGQLPVIVGLDPALPLFQDTPLDEHLDSTDAKYVEIIHTAAGCKGFDVQIGTTDFYPNFNRWRHKQPGCGADPLWACSHARAYYYFAESLITDGSFKSVRCVNFEALEHEACQESDGIAYIGGRMLEKKNAKGIYYLKTNQNSPYSIK